MHDLNTINRLNAEAAEAAKINDLRRQGLYVVGQYEGLHLTEVKSFHEAVHAAAYVHAFDRPYTQRRVVYGPITDESEDRKPAYDRGTVRAAVLRDQSEDRRQPFSLDQLAALGRRSVGDPAPAFA